jgi:hypothetical protein
MLEYNLRKKLEKNISFYKLRDLNIFIQMKIVYMCIQK